MMAVGFSNDLNHPFITKAVETSVRLENVIWQIYPELRVKYILIEKFIGVPCRILSLHKKKFSPTLRHGLYAFDYLSSASFLAGLYSSSQNSASSIPNVLGLNTGLSVVFF